MACPTEIKDKFFEEIKEYLKDKYNITTLKAIDSKLATKVVKDLNDKYDMTMSIKKDVVNDSDTKLSDVVFTKSLDGVFKKHFELAEQLEREALVKRLKQAKTTSTKEFKYKRLTKEQSISNQALSEQEDVDVDFNQVENFPLMDSSLNSISTGNKSLSIRPKNYKSKTIAVKDKLFNVFNVGKMSLEQYIAKSGKTKKQIITDFIKDETVKKDYIKDWLDGKGDMYIYEIYPSESEEDVIIDDIDDRFNLEIKRLNALRKKISAIIKNKKLSDIESTDLKEQVKEINDNIKKLQDPANQNLNELIDQAYEGLAKAKKFLGKGVNRQNIDLARSYTMGYGTLLSTFDAQGIYKDKVQDVLFEINKLLQEVTKAEVRYGKSLFTKITGKSWQEVVKDISGIELYTMSASNSLSLAGQALDKVIKEATVKINSNFEIFNTKLKNITERLESETGLKGDKATEFMVQKDVNGKNTGYIINEQTAEYYKAMNEAKNTSFSNYITWLYKNHNLSVDEKVWEEKQQSIKDYQNNRTDIISNEKQTVEEIKAAKADFIIKMYNPIYVVKYMEKISKNEANDEEIQYVKNYFTNAGWNFNKQALINKIPLDKWKDSRFVEIQNLPKDSTKKEFYDFFVNKVIEGRKFVSMYDDSSLPFSYIPEFEATSPFWQGIPDKIKDAYREKVIDGSYEIKDILTGEVINHIPVYSLENKLGAEKKSYDLTKVLESFYYEALNKKYKEEIEDDANILLRLVKNQEIVETNSKGDIIYESDGTTLKPKITVKDESNNYLQAKYLLDAQLYGKRQDKEGVTSFKSFNKAEQKQIDNFKSLQKERGFTDKQIKEDMYAGLTADEITEYKKIVEGAKNVTFKQTANSFINLTVKKSLGFNFFGGITEYLQGITAANVEAASGKYFNDTDFKRAFGLITWSNNPDVNASKIDDILKLFNVQESFNLNYKDNKIDKAAFWFLKKAERQTKGLITLAILNNEKVDINSKETPLLDIIDVKDGRLTVKDGFNDVFGSLNEEGEYIPSELRNKLEIKINAVIKRISSRDNSKDPIPLNKNILGRLVGQFRQSWMFEAFNNRFGGEREVLGLEGNVKGFYRSVFENGPKKGIEILYRVMRGQTVEGLEELDAQNAKKMLRELTWMMSTYTAYLVLSLALKGDDDDDELNPVAAASLNYLINQTYRTNRDLTFYVSPDSFQEISKNIVPAIKTMSDFMAVVSAVKDIPFGDIYLNEGKKNEEIKLFNKIERAFPVVNQPRKVYNWITNSDYTAGKK